MVDSVVNNNNIIGQSIYYVQANESIDSIEIRRDTITSVDVIQDEMHISLKRLSKYSKRTMPPENIFDTPEIALAKAKELINW